METKKGKIYIGIDLGGTKIMTGAISADGEVLGKPVKVSTGSTDPKEKIVKRITDSVEKVLENLKVNIDNIAGIGIGSTGPISIKKGEILNCPQLPTMISYPLRKTIEDIFSIPVFMNNDANCLIYGETIYGAASNNSNVVGFTLGTGIGCAIILNNQILNGSTESAGEIWPSPYLGGETIEDYISGQGVSMIYKRLSGKDNTSKEIFELAESGDEMAMNTWKEFGKHLAVPVSWGINFIDPEVIVLGGSVAKAHQFFMPALEENLRKQICQEPSKRTKVILTELGDYAGFIGAAALVLKKNY
jgi:glucokinase